MDDRSRAQRIAENEVVFRQMNERLRRRFTALDEGLDLCPFLCECGDQRCTRVIEVSLAAYADVRAHPARFLVVTGHADPGLEAIVEDAGTYQVVEKHGLAGDIARSHWRDDVAGYLLG